MQSSKRFFKCKKIEVTKATSIQVNNFFILLLKALLYVLRSSVAKFNLQLKPRPLNAQFLCLICFYNTFALNIDISYMVSNSHRCIPEEA